jgi:heterodisulfide reductase subunit C
MGKRTRKDLLPTEEGKANGEVPKVPIFIMGKRYEVPASLTIQKAFEYAGYQLIRGCGCRGGICGACGTVYRFPVVQPNMYLTMIPFFPANRAIYDLEEIRPDLESLMKLYPDVMRCVQCNTCTKSCPMDIEVMDYMAAAMRGGLAKVAELSFDCVMCGLCASRCPAEIAQYHVAILARRLYGKYILPKSEHTEAMVKRIEEGKYGSMLTGLMESDEDQLKKLYTEREIEPEGAGEGNAVSVMFIIG